MRRTVPATTVSHPAATATRGIGKISRCTSPAARAAASRRVPAERRGGDPPPEPQPSVSVSFDKPVVIFEAPYESSPGIITQPPPSTQTKLTVSAYGGANGRTLDIQLSGGLCEVPGSDPRPTLVAAFEQVEWEAYCEATNASPHINGAVATATFTDSVTGQEIASAPATATAVKIRVTPSKVAPENYSSGRHKYGIREIVNCLQSPSSPTVTWTAMDGGFSDSTNYVDFICPLYSASNPLQANIGNVISTPNITVVEPQSVIALDARSFDYGEHQNQAGYVGMDIDLCVGPLDVSFERLSIEEVPCSSGSHIGYFANTYFSNLWCHSIDNGAGRWQNVGYDNEFAMDRAECANALPRMILPGYPGESIFGWYYGYMCWDVPYGWRSKNPPGNVSLSGTFAEDVKHEVTIDANGTVSIFKLGCCVSRSTNDFVMVHGGVNNE